LREIRPAKFGIGVVSAPIAEAVLRDERIVIPIGSYHPSYGVTLSTPRVLGREGVVHILEPDLAENERQALQRGTETLKSAVARLKERACSASLQICLAPLIRAVPRAVTRGKRTVRGPTSLNLAQQQFDFTSCV